MAAKQCSGPIVQKKQGSDTIRARIISLLLLLINSDTCTLTTIVSSNYQWMFLRIIRIPIANLANYAQCVTTDLFDSEMLWPDTALLYHADIPASAKWNRFVIEVIRRVMTRS
jgi:hypothetical protein